jgi:hypothetical protein
MRQALLPASLREEGAVPLDRNQIPSRLQRTCSFHVSFSIWGRLLALVCVGTRSDRKIMRERKENAIHFPFPNLLFSHFSVRYFSVESTRTASPLSRSQ